jgi:xylitol oxidase
MSPAYQRDVVGIHFTWKPLWTEVEPMLGLIEKLLDPFNPCPHFGKLFAMPSPRMQEVYPRLPEFAKLADAHDPNGKFWNDFLENILG